MSVDYNKLESQLVDFPPAIRQKVINEVRRAETIQYFRYNPNLNWRTIKAKVKDILKEFNLPISTPIEKRELRTANDWQSAYDASYTVSQSQAYAETWSRAFSEIQSRAHTEAQSRAQDRIRSATYTAVWSRARGATENIAKSAVWELASDLPDFRNRTNPFKKMVDMFKMGLYPIGVVNGKFVIYYIPRPKAKKKTLNVGEAKKTIRRINGAPRMATVKKVSRGRYSVRVVNKRRRQR